jgi:predicted nucleotidyltransferase
MSVKTVAELSKKGIIKPPSYAKSTHYETIMGSFSYGVSSDSSDIDIYGFCIPPKEDVFPHLKGEIIGFGRQINRFEQWQQHHVVYEKKQYDFHVYNIVKYFSLCMENNPNMVDSLYTPPHCIVNSSKIGDMVRDERKIFLHKGSYHKFKGYAFSQLHKAKNKNPESKRREIIKKYGYDVKFAYHVVRLADECEQILTTGTLDLGRAREHLKAIRRGEVPLEQIDEWFAEKEHSLEKLYHECNILPYSPDEFKIKNLLLHCLEEHYGKLENCIIIPSKAENVLKKIKEDIIKARF